MGEDIVLNSNGKQSFIIPLALFTLIIGGILYVAVTMTRVSTQLELLQRYNETEMLRKEQDRKYFEDKMDLYRLEVHKLDKDVALLQQTSNINLRRDK